MATRTSISLLRDKEDSDPISNPSISWVLKTFVIYTNASDYQLGALTTQECRTLNFYSRILNSDQENYTVTKTELLSVAETHED